jgi:low affinity Fe/Cu permease
MKLPVIFLLLFLMAPASFAADKKAQNQDPVVWGILTQNTGCVIFQEGHKTKGMYWGVAVTTKTFGKLTVVETQNYAMDEKEFLETQETMDDLMRRAQRDRVKFVKIHEKYSPEQFDKARAMCKQDQ